MVIAGGSITKDQRHTYNLPLPLSLRSKAEWHRFTVTLAFAAPTVGTLNRYRGSLFSRWGNRVQLVVGRTLSSVSH